MKKQEFVIIDNDEGLFQRYEGVSYEQSPVI
jgi:hypothetical protein